MQITALVCSSSQAVHQGIFLLKMLGILAIKPLASFISVFVKYTSLSFSTALLPAMPQMETGIETLFSSARTPSKRSTVSILNPDVVRVT
jgi:hypothetical protein